MKKFYLVLLCFFMAIGVSYSQGTDPVVAKLLLAIERLQAQNLAVQTSIEMKTDAMLAKQIGATTTQVIDGLQSLDRISQLLQSFYCQSSQTSYLIEISGSTNCLLDMDINLALLNITYSQDVLKTVFLLTSTYFLMEQSTADRIGKLSDLADAIERSMRIFKKLNSSLSLRLDKALVNDLLIREQKRIATGVFGVNRYSRQ